MAKRPEGIPVTSPEQKAASRERYNSTARRATLREQAQARQAERDERSSAEQLALLQQRGHGNCAEAERLAYLIAEENAA